MFLKFKKIRLVNFLSFGDATIDLNNTGYVLVKGINKNPVDNADSNGSGKSSIWEALSWCLTGETIRGSKDIININSNDGAYVELVFNVDNDEYRILRSKEHSVYKTNLKIWINNIDKSGKGIRDGEKLLNEYLPDLTSQLIGSVIILGQGLPQRFTNNTPSGRKEVLERLSKSDFMIEDLKNRISNRKLELSKSLREFEDAILALSTEDKILRQNLNNTQTLLSNLEHYNINELVKNKDELNFNISKVNQEIESLQMQLLNNDNEIDSVNEQLNNIRNFYTQEREKLNEQNNSNFKLLIERKIQLETEIKNCKNIIKDYENITDICPTCGQKIEGIIKPDTSSYYDKLEKCKIELYQVENELNLISTNINLNNEKLNNELNTKESEILQLKSNLHSKRQQFNFSINSNRNNLNSMMNELTKLTNIINEYDVNKARYEQQIYDITKNLDEINEKLLYNNSKKLIIQERLEVISKMNTIITRDFRGYLLINVIDFINKKAKEYAIDVFNTDKINFSLDKNNISISYDEKEYENLSGGEKQKVDLIVQFAIRDMLCKFLNFSSNLIVLDELFDNLDSIGCQKVLNLISSKLSDVESIYIVTHHADIEIPTDRELTIVKGENKISFIQ